MESGVYCVSASRIGDGGVSVRYGVRPHWYGLAGGTVAKCTKPR